MKLSNSEIYNYTRFLMDAFNDGEQKLPIKVNFYLSKNKKILFDLAQEIEKTRLEIAQQFGVLDESGEQYAIPPEKLEQASRELEDLFTLVQEVPIQKIAIEAIDPELSLTTAQMEALMFMIE